MAARKKPLTPEERKEAQRRGALRASVTKALSRRRHERPTPKSAPAVHAAEIVEGYFGAAMEVIQYHLLAGNLQAAMWVGNRHLDLTGTKVDNPIKLPENATPVDAAKAIMERVFAGELTVETGNKLMQAVERHTAIAAGEKLDELREAIEDLKKLQGSTINGKAKASQSPAWLKLKQDSPVADAETTD